MPRKTNKKKIKVISETHGKVEDGKPTTLDQIWGDTGLWKYNTMNLSEYKKYLNDMNKTDLQAHAKKIGLIPIDDRITLNRRLLSEFKKHVSSYSSLAQTKNEPEQISEEVKKILSEGR
jgi:hypothetical protein